MRGRWASIGAVFLLVLVLSSFAALPASSTRFRLGAEIQFKIEDSSTWFWGCCGCCECEDTLILGWRVVNSVEQVVYSVVHDAPVASPVWLGTWTQVDSGGVAVPVGYYKLYVDTSAGTLSRCFTLYDPCSCYWGCNICSTCACTDVACITTCACRTSLVFVDTCSTRCCFPLFWGWGCCGCSSCP